MYIAVRAQADRAERRLSNSFNADSCSPHREQATTATVLIFFTLTDGFVHFSQCL